MRKIYKKIESTIQGLVDNRDEVIFILKDLPRVFEKGNFSFIIKSASEEQLCTAFAMLTTRLNACDELGMVNHYKRYTEEVNNFKDAVNKYRILRDIEEKLCNERAKLSEVKLLLSLRDKQKLFKEKSK